MEKQTHLLQIPSSLQLKTVYILTDETGCFGIFERISDAEEALSKMKQIRNSNPTTAEIEGWPNYDNVTINEYTMNKYDMLGTVLTN